MKMAIGLAHETRAQGRDRATLDPVVLGEREDGAPHRLADRTRAVSTLVVPPPPDILCPEDAAIPRHAGVDIADA